MHVFQSSSFLCLTISIAILLVETIRILHKMFLAITKLFQISIHIIIDLGYYVILQLKNFATEGFTCSYESDYKRGGSDYK